ncbi:DUF4910 domain-containing protein, partial [candidate division KSB1 bacterium]|nr:DUF4910 domain-containing protein [candidate division KSB1 bacterium]
MYSLLQRLFPICRSITGDGVRETLAVMKAIIPPLKIKEIPSGTKVFDWTVPDEWNVRDAYVRNESGERVIDFKKSNLHLVGYSTPFEGFMTLKELIPHLYTLPDQPDWIPYVTSYYERNWGFCLSHRQFSEMKDETYFVKIDSSLEPGHLTYGELLIEGETDREILLSTNICHPSMANNELSGPVVTTFLAKYLLERVKKPHYTYRIIFIPETIGSIAYLSMHHNYLKKRTIAGYTVTCVGDRGKFSYLKTRRENTLVDRVTLHVLKHKAKNSGIYDFLKRGSDEMQYCSPGIDLPVGSLMRTKYHEYPEYHTSADNLAFVSPKSLDESLEMYKLCLDALEKNRIYKNTVLCEPQLGRRGLYHQISTKENIQKNYAVL